MDLTRLDRRTLIAALGVAVPAGALAAVDPNERPMTVAAATQESPTRTLAAFAAGYPLSQVPEEVRTLFQALILDTATVMLAGSVQPVHRMTRAGLAAAVGPGSVWALGGAKVPLSSAVMLDALAAADFEFEHVMAATHPASAALPALLALAAERDLSGEDLLGATIMAYELACRIGAASGSAVEHERGFHNPGLNGTIAAAAGCARLLRLDADRCASAMGLAASSSAGLMAFLDDGAMTKRLHPARSAQLGLESAFLAAAGVEGPRTVLESPHGFLHAFSPRPDLEALTAQLGERWRSSRMIIKLSPVHAYAQAWVEAVNAARDRGESWRAADVVAVTAEATPDAFPNRHEDLDPGSLVAAQYSVPFCVAIAVARDLRNPMLVDDSTVKDPDVRRLAKLMSFTRTAGGGGAASSLSIKLKDRTLMLPIGVYAGSPGSPDYVAAIERKFERTLAGLGIAERGKALRAAVDGLADPSGPRRLRAELIAASKSIA